ncbi:hypothetical protein BJ508DRAFT_335523 [Ascobolus immersus RN42]|uniref:Uncharacterized protein n=1 Tax=Ascobolus immersus RN42 TaxID=1160509 RepID=A0A3N4HC31_ASCIM|nr:hypothetical protein BJ508DRAFT_335523 [Ascobolus immersus RN42]
MSDDPTGIFDFEEVLRRENEAHVKRLAMMKEAFAAKEAERKAEEERAKQEAERQAQEERVKRTEAVAAAALARESEAKTVPVVAASALVPSAPASRSQATEDEVRRISDVVEGMRVAMGQAASAPAAPGPSTPSGCSDIRDLETTVTPFALSRYSPLEAPAPIAPASGPAVFQRHGQLLAMLMHATVVLDADVLRDEMDAWIKRLGDLCGTPVGKDGKGKRKAAAVMDLTGMDASRITTDVTKRIRYSAGLQASRAQPTLHSLPKAAQGKGSL